MACKFYVPPVQNLPLNTKGRDFVIGDIHGRYDLVYEALSKVKFNEQTDRLFCVGDLIDRGQYSDHVADFLAKPFVYAIRGNHEDILLKLYESNTGKSPEKIIANISDQIGLHWWMHVEKKEKIRILDALRKLPLVLEVETSRGNVGLVHGEVDRDLTWQEFVVDINNNKAHVVQEALWGRSRLSYGISDIIQGIGRVYVGHTVQDKIKKLGNVVAIDTGAVFDKHLTIVNMITHTQMIEDSIPDNDAIHVLHHVGDAHAPFNNYIDIPKITGKLT